MKQKEKNYWPLNFIHNQLEPVGYFGNGVHYGIIRVPQQVDMLERKLASVHAQDLAVIWDADHDERILKVIEQLYVANLLGPVMFIGECRAKLTILVDSEFLAFVSTGFEEYVTKVAKVAHHAPAPDSWAVEVGWYSTNAGLGKQPDAVYDIVKVDHRDNINLYLKHIDMLWNLGYKQYDSLL